MEHIEKISGVFEYIYIWIQMKEENMRLNIFIKKI